MVRLFCGYFVVCNYACNSTESGVPQGAGVDGEDGRIAPCPCMMEETILVIPGKRGHCFDGRTICNADRALAVLTLQRASGASFCILTRMW